MMITVESLEELEISMKKIYEKYTNKEV